MEIRPIFRSIAARLVSTPPAAPARSSPALRQRMYRPLIVGAAILRRPTGSGERWLVPVSRDGRLWPLAPLSQAAVRGRVRGLCGAGLECRVAAALAVPADVSPAMRFVVGRSRPGVEFYGWSLLYQLPAMRGVAFVDPHTDLPDLPAIYESPLEVIDRAEFLASRGVVTRPLVVVTQTEDFTGRIADSGHRTLPCPTLSRPGDLDWLA